MTARSQAMIFIAMIAVIFLAAKLAHYALGGIVYG